MGVEPLEVFNDSSSDEEEEDGAPDRRRRRGPKPMAVQRIGVWKLRKGAAHPKRSKEEDATINSRDGTSARGDSMHENDDDDDEVTHQSLTGALQSSLRNLRYRVSGLLPATSQGPSLNDSIGDGDGDGDGDGAYEDGEVEVDMNRLMSGFGGLPGDEDSPMESTPDAPFATLEIVFYHTNFAHLAQVVLTLLYYSLFFYLIRLDASLVA